MEINLKLQQDDGKLLSNPLLYRQLVKSLIFLLLYNKLVSLYKCLIILVWLLYELSFIILKIFMVVGYSFL